jgi:hypothetical protein
MRFRIGMVSLRERVASWRILLAILVLVLVALVGGLPLRQIQALQHLEQMTVNFSASTPPIRSGVICKDRDYQIEVRPKLLSVEVGELPVLGSKVLSLTRPDFGTLNGRTEPTGRNTSVGGAAVFTYRAQRTGQEKLNFGWTNFVPPTFPPNPSYEDIEAQLLIEGDTEFLFEVRECTYAVTFISSYQFAQGGVNAVNFGLMTKTQLEPKEDGTFEGNGSFVITNLVSAPVCTATYADATVPNRITGKLIEDFDELELTFEYRKGSYVTDAKCPRASGSTTSELDVSGIAPKSLNIPKEGGTKSFPFPGPGRGSLKIIVEQVVAD